MYGGLHGLYGGLHMPVMGIGYGLGHGYGLGLGYGMMGHMGYGIGMMRGYY